MPAQYIENIKCEWKWNDPGNFESIFSII